MTVKIPFQIEIPRRSLVCAKGQEELVPGSAYYSTVANTDDGRMTRQDYCATCWDALKQLPEFAVKTYWKSRIPKKIEDDRLQTKDEKALEVFRAALKEESLESAAEAFVLALYLVRRKLLAYRQQIEQFGVPTSLYEILATEEVVGVRTVALSQLQIATLQQTLAAKLINTPKKSATSAGV